RMMSGQVDLSRLAHDVADDLRKECPECNVEFAIEEGLVAQGDQRLLRVVLYNLISNAWKFSGKQSKPVIAFGSTRQGGKATYFVRDNGVGFDMKYADKLFGAFQRLHTMAEFPGTGIGLATVQRIVHRHGGRAWAEAEVGKGATFHFTL
ncbi:PAS/PAC sensor signal transduction histidine kinase, partial [hydrothermal vent metagenome]